MEKYVSVGVQKAKMIQEVDSFQDHHNELEEEKKMDRSKAISILDVKWSTFCSLVHSKKKQEARLLLGHALVEKTHEWRQNGFLASDQYNPYGSVSDVSVIHEAYQFLIDCIADEEKKYQSLLVSTNNLTDSNWGRLKHKYFLKITGSSEEENMETIRKTEEVMNAMQNMPSFGEELSFRRTIKAIKEPTENRRGSEQLEHTDTKGTYNQAYISVFEKGTCTEEQVKNKSIKSSIKRSYQPLNPRRKRLWQS